MLRMDIFRKLVNIYAISWMIICYAGRRLIFSNNCSATEVYKGLLGFEVCYVGQKSRFTDATYSLLKRVK